MQTLYIYYLRLMAKDMFSSLLVCFLVCLFVSKITEKCGFSCNFQDRWYKEQPGTFKASSILPLDHMDVFSTFCGESVPVSNIVEKWMN